MIFYLESVSCIHCNHVDWSLPGSSAHGLLQARILKWVAIPFPGDLPDPGIEPRSPALQAASLLSPGKPHFTLRVVGFVTVQSSPQLEVHHISKGSLPWQLKANDSNITFALHPPLGCKNCHHCFHWTYSYTIFSVINYPLSLFLFC